MSAAPTSKRTERDNRDGGDGARSGQSNTVSHAMRQAPAMTRLLRAFPPQFALIVPATLILYLVSPLVAEGSVSASSVLVVFSFASILAIAAIGQTLVIQQGGLDLSVPGVISLAAVLVTKYPTATMSLWCPGSRW